MRVILQSMFRVAVLLCPLAAGAHDTLPEDWCQDGHLPPAVAREFNFDEDELMARIRAFEETHDHSRKPPQPGLFDSRCGIVDMWSWADLIAAGYCAETSEEANAMPIILDPPSFLDTEHHREYRLSEGLRGACVVCEKKDSAR
ncbi:hypothetical protein [Aquimonas voraii]|uniref:Uncharacterized protein n=1 Tax=Aquimonas voraii TaxID=265719 RepID=A0A1G6XD23_9GAMM|nr:hypothetical protein [Aquimonas voraii]SDD76109.1 hypothetical protein SAMN04488509_106174 [Aquimonas voraii]